MKTFVHRILGIWAVLLLVLPGSTAWTPAAVLQKTGRPAGAVWQAGPASRMDVPTALTPITNVTYIEAGEYHTCAVVSGGLKCWGGNPEGQLGTGSTSTLPQVAPIDVSGLTSGVSAVAAGRKHTCALTSSGGVKCWGDNHGGQLGDNSTAPHYTPADVYGLTGGVQFIDAGRYHNCAVTNSGGVKCWGNNQDGEMGDGTNGTDRLIPVNVSGLSGGVRVVAGGWYHSAALTTGGGVKCWGGNWLGQCGDGSLTSRLTPANVSGLTSGSPAMTANGYHACAVTSAGGVKCWGSNDYGQLGNGNTTGQKYPVNVIGLSSGITAVAAGVYHTCALVSDGRVRCWGNNQYGQLGDGTTSSRPTQAEVHNLTDAVAITAGGYFTCAQTSSGGMKCWGANESGQLGDGTTTNRLVPLDVLVDGPINYPPVISEGDSIDLSTLMNTPVNRTLHATDPNSDSLTWSLFTPPNHGSVTLSSSNTSVTIRYSPYTNFTGSDSFTVQVSDNRGGEDYITVYVTVTQPAVNHAPVIAEGSSTWVTMSQNGWPVAFNLALHANDQDGDTLTWSIYRAAYHGNASVSGTGTSKSIGYNPGYNYTGQDSFVVQVSDGHADNGVARITVNVTIQSPDEKRFLYVPVLSHRYFHGPLENEPNNDSTQANGPLIPGQVYNGYPNDDRDYFYFDLGSTSNVSVSLTNHYGLGVQLHLFYQTIGNEPYPWPYSDDKKLPPYSLTLNATNAQPGRYYVYIFMRQKYITDKLYNLTVTVRP